MLIRYVTSLLREHDINFLVNLDAQMGAQKRSLDSAMQMLVCQNYNKFIDATDKMTEMKVNVEAMEGEMTQLVQNISKIATKCEKIESNLSENRQKTDNLVGVSRLLSKLEFLFELPGRLKRSIELGALTQAVKYYVASDHILRQQQHLPSFAKIRQESESLMAGVRVTLKASLSDGKMDCAEQLEHAELLVTLGMCIRVSRYGY